MSDLKVPTYGNPAWLLIRPDEVETSMKLLSSRAKTRDPVRSTTYCKDRQHALDPGSRPGRQI